MKERVEPVAAVYKFKSILFQSCYLKFQIIRVMPLRHPSRPYTAELERRFRDAEGVFVQAYPAEVT